MSESPARHPTHIRKRFPWGWLLLGVIGTGALLGLAVVRNAPLAVSVLRPTVFKAGERNPLLTASGYLVARHRATLSAKVPGRLAWLGVEEGSRVAKGQVLARLESPDLVAAREQVKAQLDQAAVDLDRAQKLQSQGIQDVATVDRLRSQKLTLEALLRYQDAVLENMVIRAPFAGTVTQKLSEVGETVSPGTAGGVNAINAIATLADFNSLELEVEVNETGITKLRKGMPAEIRVDALEAGAGAKPLMGTLREIYPTSNRQKAVVVVRVAILDHHPALLPDMGAKVTFLGDPFGQDTLLIGREQVVRRGGKTFVWTAAEGKAVLHPVVLGEENPIGYEAKGLAADLPLLVVPQEIKLEVGKAVTLKEH